MKRTRMLFRSVRLALFFSLAFFASLFGAIANEATAAEAQWIWATEDANKSAPTGTCHFSKTFTMQEPESGLLEITCDNRYVLRLNGRLVGASNSWETLDRYEVTSLLVPGENTIDVRCVNDDQAAGLAVRVVVKSKGAEPVTHSSDKTWVTRLNVGRSWNPAAMAEVKPVPTVVLGEFGKTVPWGMPKKIGPLIKRDKSADDLKKPFELVDGDRVVWLGNTFIERAQTYGYLETALTIRWPERNITFRNLGWSGDTVTGIARARFGDVNEGFRHLTEHVYALKPTVIFVAYGANESFAGEAGLDKFGDDLSKLLDTLESTGARIVLISPLRQENLGPPLPDPTKQNRNILLYGELIREVAAERGCRYVDLDEAIYGDEPEPGQTPISPSPLTDNGVHLTELGYWRAGLALWEALGIAPPKVEIDIDVRSATAKAIGAKVTDIIAQEGTCGFIVQHERLPYPRLPETVPSNSEPFKQKHDLSAYQLHIPGLKAGEYHWLVDGEEIGKPGTRLVESTSVTVGPQFQQVEALRQLILKKNELYFHRWRPQNETYLYLFRKHEQGNNAKEIPEFDPLVEELEQEIARLRQPVPHKFELKRVE